MANVQKEGIVKIFGSYLGVFFQVISLVVMIYSAIYVVANTTRDIKDLTTWRTATEQRLSMSENDVRALQTLIDKLTYKLASLERESEISINTMKELEKASAAQTLAITQQVGEWKLVKEILQRVESRIGNPR